MNRPLYAILVTLVLLLSWQSIVWLTGVPRYILPSPQRVLETLWSQRNLITEHALITLLEVVLGLILGVLLGVVTAVTIAYSRLARIWLRPMLLISQALPVFALAPLLTLWFGYGLTSKVMMALLIIFFPVTSALFDGLMRTPTAYIDLAKTMGASRWSLMFRIRFPAALPNLASGIRLAAVYAPIGAVIGEWVGSSQGLGYLMLLANGRVKTDLMFASMLVLAALSVGLYFLIDASLRRMLRY
ncbi:MAG TPA: ABC transporter permease [Marinobacterium sp.]|nr:ABC transporter permease [Marinobacterium sp.]